MLPGAQINLKLFCEAGTPTNIQWSLPGSVFKSYDVTENKATLTNLSAGDLTKDTVQFYWGDVGDGRAVTVDFKLGAKQCTRSATLNVKDPVVRFPAGSNPPRVGVWDFNPSKPAKPLEIWLTDANGANTPGAIFAASVGLPAGFDFNAAEWQFGQLIGGSRLAELPNNVCKEMNTGGMLTNNAPWPYTSDSSPGTPPYPADGKTEQSVGDTPAFGVAGRTQSIVGDFYKMYIMFKPAPDPPGAEASAWVSLMSASWSSSACAQLGAAGWAIRNPLANANPWAIDRTPPTWSQKWQSTPVKVVNCPGNC